MWLLKSERERKKKKKKKKKKKREREEEREDEREREYDGKNSLANCRGMKIVQKTRILVLTIPQAWSG